MAHYTVHLTFAAPALSRTFERRTHLRRRESYRMTGSGGMLSAVVVVQSDQGSSAAGRDAAALITREWAVHGTGSLRLLSWTAHRQRVLAGLRGRRGPTCGTGVTWVTRGSLPPGCGDLDDPGDDGGLAGVREPRRPKPGPPSLGMSLPLPGDPRRA